VPELVAISEQQQVACHVAVDGKSAAS